MILYMTKHKLLAAKTGQEVVRYQKIRHFEKYALGHFARANVFSVIFFLSFCSPAIMLRNRGKTRAAVD